MPTIVYSLVDNQLMVPDEFAKQRIMLSIGDFCENIDFIHQMSVRIKMLCVDKELRLYFSS